MELEIQLAFPVMHNPAKGNAASTFPQKEKKGLAKREGHWKASNKHAQMQEEEERKSLSVTLNKRDCSLSYSLTIPLWAKWLSDEDSISAREERKNVNLRPKTHQDHKKGEQTYEREKEHAHTPPLERRQNLAARSSGWRVQSTRQSVLTLEVGYTDMEAEEASYLN